MKIAISGAGVAGPTLAFWLLKAGHEPTLIESAPALRTAGYMIDFWGVGFEIAERMDLIEEVRAAGYDLKEMRYLDARGRHAGSILADTVRRELGDRFTSLPRGELAAIIFHGLAGRVETILAPGYPRSTSQGRASVST
jgi:2-polyprenyl-6-methoxyphenol hydroxylase-like FAD-dependent oxidoreductase